MPIAAATPATIYKYLMNKAKTYGTKSGDDYIYSYYIDDNTIFGIFWDKSESQEELLLYVPDSNIYVCMFLPSSGKTPYIVDVEIGDSIHANYSVNPATYTGSGTLTETYYSGNTSAKSQVLALAKEALNLILEFTLIELWDDGYRLKDLGFTKYTQHNVHYYDSGKVTTKPTCVDTGVKTYTCKICKTQKYYEEIPATGIHTWKLSQVFNPGYEDADGNVVHGSAKYACKYCSATKNADLCAEVIFTDMPARTNYAHNAIDWAVFNGITDGTSDTTFSPNKGCTRGQVVTFLWRAAGKPEPSGSNPFTDVKSTAYYYDPVRWAVENGITTGTSETKFSPDNTCTRGQIVTFLWRYEGSPAPETTVNPFSDVNEANYFYSAVLWAQENGITKGTSDTEFSPTKTCTRAQVVTFLYRDVRLESAAQASENGAQALAALLDRAADADVETVDASAVPAYAPEDAAEQLPEAEAAESGEVRFSANTLRELLATRGAAEVLCQAPRFSVQPDALSVLYALTEELEK